MTSRSWVFTLNNYTENDEQFFKDLDSKYTCFGKEMGENGTPHLQGFIIFSRAYRLTQLKKLHTGAHWEKAKACDAGNYCMKDQDYFLKDLREQGKRTDIQEYVEFVKAHPKERDAAITHPAMYMKYHGGTQRLIAQLAPQRSEKPEVIWIYGPTGIGKTRFVYDTNEDIWSISFHNGFWLGYNFQAVALWDDFRPSDIKFNLLLKFLDRYPFDLNIKGGSAPFTSMKIFITCHSHPEDLYAGTGEEIRQLLRRVDQIIKLSEELSQLSPSDVLATFV